MAQAANTNGGKPFTNVTAFQQQMLAVLAREGPEYGLGIKRAVADVSGEEVNHGRLYPNLDTLVDMGMVEKSERDKRTNEYALTESGRDVVRSQFVWLDSCLEGGDDE